MKKITRKSFLKKAGILLATGPFVLRSHGAISAKSFSNLGTPPFNCILAPSHTGGPFYLDPNYDRKNITEGEPGIPTRLKIKVLGVDNCEPVPNAIVNIWHTDYRGGYSEFGQVFGNPVDASDLTWYRGYQKTNNLGECEFDTNFPGWYPGRATHIHYDVHIGFMPGGTVDTTPNATSSFYSQMYFPDALRSKVYSEIAPYTDIGDNPTGNTEDILYNNEAELKLAFDETDYPNSLTADFCIGLDMAGIPVGVNEAEGKEYFQLEQNAPNPFSNTTNIPFVMKNTGMITLSVFNLKGELITQLLRRRLSEGEYSVDLDKNKVGGFLPAGSYVFEMMVENQAGRFRQSRSMKVV